jgi:LPXTG-motif cell wall-anchored protein
MVRSMTKHGDVRDLQQQQLHDPRHHARSGGDRDRHGRYGHRSIARLHRYHRGWRLLLHRHYSGDANNNAVAGKCGDANESVHVNPAPVAVLPEKVGKPPVVVLPHTGASLPVGPTVGGAIALLGLGLLLMAAAGRRRSSRLPRR